MASMETKIMEQNDEIKQLNAVLKDSRRFSLKILPNNVLADQVFLY